jgi:sugar lactone lactonase YvrE
VLSTFANLPVPGGTFTTGLKFGPDGYLYAATAGFTPDPAVAFVWRISPDGDDVEEYAELDPNGFPNDLAFDDDGNLYVTDPFLAQVWKIDEDGDADVWLSDPLLAANFENPYLVVAPFGVDGIAFDKHHDNLYVGNLDYGRILKIPVDCHGEAGDIDVFYEDIGLIGGVDGIAFDNNETLFLAVHGQDRIVSIDKHRKAQIVAQGAPLQQPSSLVFGTTKAAQKTLYIANFSILAVFGVKPGPPTPGVLKLPVKTKGLPLP